MSGLTFEQLRIPIALILLFAAAFVFLPRGDDTASAGVVARPETSIIVGQPGGEVIFPETPAPEATPLPTPAPTPTQSPESTPQVAEDGFGAEVLACRSISGSSCDGQLGTLPPDAGSFTVLVTFTDANAGDTINAVLSGPAGTIPGGAYTLQGGGDGYYYSTFSAGGLPAGEYHLVATRNGTEVATTDFTRGG